jgi:hypothetical protein
MEDHNHLYILWTTDNLITAEKMIVMYGGNSLLKDWWEQVTIIIWGASAQLVSTNPAIQNKITELLSMGVHVSACKRCADDLGVASQLEDLGIEVKYWGEPLTAVLKSGSKLLTI